MHLLLFVVEPVSSFPGNFAPSQSGQAHFLIGVLFCLPSVLTLGAVEGTEAEEWRIVFWARQNKGCFYAAIMLLPMACFINPISQRVATVCSDFTDTLIKHIWLWWRQIHVLMIFIWLKIASLQYVSFRTENNNVYLPPMIPSLNDSDKNQPALLHISRSFLWRSRWPRIYRFCKFTSFCLLSVGIKGLSYHAR